MKEDLRMKLNTALYLSSCGRKRYRHGLESNNSTKKRMGLKLFVKGVIIGDRVSSDSKRTFDLLQRDI